MQASPYKNNLTKISRQTKPRKNPVAQQQPVAPPLEATKIPVLFSYTTCTPYTGSSSWEAIYKLFEDEEPRVMGKIVTTEDSLPVFETTYSNVANLLLHRIATRPNILPYTDMIRWVIDHLNIENMNFMTKRNTFIGSFTNNDLIKIY